MACICLIVGDVTSVVQYNIIMAHMRKVNACITIFGEHSNINVVCVSCKSLNFSVND